ncbi:hypothetical protein ONS96_005286 [Cadophora gregata f. sp. sojae]|nr:hypothetical protein ONS96_005286 [Cadophora gregata f. sp. sojae]
MDQSRSSSPPGPPQTSLDIKGKAKQDETTSQKKARTSSFLDDFKAAYPDVYANDSDSGLLFYYAVLLLLRVEEENPDLVDDNEVDGFVALYARSWHPHFLKQKAYKKTGGTVKPGEAVKSYWATWHGGLKIIASQMYNKKRLTKHVLVQIAQSQEGGDMEVMLNVMEDMEGGRRSDL